MIDVSLLGTERDFRTRGSLMQQYQAWNINLTRSFIYRGGHSITSTMVEDILQPTSLVPTRVSNFTYVLLWYRSDRSPNRNH